MARFRRTQPSKPQTERTPEERERERAEREARRAAASRQTHSELAPEPGPVTADGEWAPVAGQTAAEEPTPLRPGPRPEPTQPDDPDAPPQPATPQETPPGVVPFRRDAPPPPLDPAAEEHLSNEYPRRPVQVPKPRTPEESEVRAAPTDPGIPSPRARPVVAPPKRVRETIPPPPEMPGHRRGIPSRLPRPGRPAPPPRTSSSQRRRRRMLALLPILLTLALLGFAYEVFQPFHGKGHGQVAVTIPAGSSASKVGDILARDHVVSSGFFFTVRAWISGKRSDIRPGHYVLARDMSYGDALGAITRPGPVVHAVKVTIPEGESRRQIAALAHADGLTGNYLAAAAHSRSLDPRRYGAPAGTPNLEGFLFPATYTLTAGSPVRGLVDDQLAAFKRAFGKVNLGWARQHNLTPYDVLTVASMVEREAGVPRDRPLIAAVIYNRLRAHMPLGIDATVRYALNDWSRPLTASDLRIPSRYNTRLHKGLPPTPIGNPGRASLEAAAHPAHARYLYYVVKPGGHGEHLFATTYAQFLRDAASYQRARARNRGRSPTH